MKRGGRTAPRTGARLSVLAFIAWLLLLGTQPARPHELGLPFHAVHGPEQWRGGAMVYVAARDARGVLLFGTEAAVLEHDGAAWRRIELPGRTVRSLALGAADEVYVGATGDFGLLEHDGAGGRRYRSLAAALPAELRPFGAVWSINVAPEGVYFQSSEWLVLRRGDGTFATWRPARGFHKSFLLEGTLYVREVGRGLMALRGERLELVAPQFAADGVYFMLPWAPGQALVGAKESGLHLLDLRSGALARPAGFEALSAQLGRDQLFHGVELASGRLAFSTLTGGVTVSDRQGRVLERLQSPRIPLRGEFAHHLLPDGDNLWLALNNGIAYLETGTPVRYWDRSAGFRGTVYGIQRWRGRLYFASGLATSTLEGDALRELQPSMPAWAIATVSPRGGGERLLVGTINGIYEVTDGEPRLLTTMDSSGNVYGLYAEPGTDTVWVSTRQGLARLRWTGGRWEEEPYVPGLAEEVRTVRRARDGALWVARLQGGVARLDGERVTRLGAAEGLPAEGGVGLASWDGDVVFLTARGLYRFDAGLNRFLPDARFGASLADGSTGVHLFVPGHHGDAWLAVTGEAGHRVEHLQPNVNGFVREPQGLDRLPVMPVESLYPEADGTLWVGGKEGIFRVEAARLPPPSRPPASILRRFMVNGEPAALGAAPEVPFDRSALELAWACPFPAQGRPLEYRWRLRGYDDAWSPWSTETRKELSRLPEGSYVFEVKARTFDGVEAAPAAQAFTVLPPWQRTGPARLLFLLLLAAAVRVVVRLNVRRLTRDKERLEQVVAVRTAEVVAQKGEIEAQHRSIQAAIRYAERIQRATLPGREVVGAAVGEAAVLYRPRDVVSGDFYWTAERDGHHFLALADCTGHGVPGALLAMLGQASLDDLVLRQGLREPQEILQALEGRVAQSLRQGAASGADGMEVALLRFGAAPGGGREAVISGTGVPVHVVQAGTARRIRSRPGRPAREVVPVQPGDLLCLASDGFADQLDGEDRRFGSARFAELLVSLAAQPAAARRALLEAAFDAHRGSREQLDDVTVIVLEVAPPTGDGAP